MASKFNPYRAWANDGKVLSQVKWAPAPTYTQCVKCHTWVKDGTQQMVNLQCESCQGRQIAKILGDLAQELHFRVFQQKLNAQMEAEFQQV